ncbi:MULTISPECIES: hypothetical protein [Lysinibacillus]|uniref:hypothetical protein n=1 Tax=Lysinibacillus TaxID=400634 RepID=UPI00056AC1A6|nr:hypothetical protein [Lysinibacillus sphaericus]
MKSVGTKSIVKLKPIEFKDRLDRRFNIEGVIDEPISLFLNKNHIPIDAVIVKKDGSIIDDWQERIQESSEYVVEMVRAYHLPDFLSLLRLWDTKLISGKIKVTEDAYYTKRLFLHNDYDGDYTATQTSFNKEEFVSYLDQVFVDGIMMNRLIEKNDRIALAMSGGRDSLSLGYFLSRNREHFPDHTMSSFHVNTFSKPKETRFAQEIAERFNFEHNLITNDQVKEQFRLKKDPNEVLDFIKYDYNKSYSIAGTHIIMRSAVEKAAREQGFKKLSYGLMKEDLMSTIIKCIFVGFPFNGPFNRKFGDFDIIYPLWPISKKELTLYLEAITPSHNRQESPSEFERGSLSRDIYYLIADTIETILPGAGLQLLNSQKTTLKHLVPNEYKQCENCTGTYSISYQPEYEIIEREYKDVGLCGLCQILEEHNFIRL